MDVHRSAGNRQRPGGRAAEGFGSRYDVVPINYPSGGQIRLMDNLLLRTGPAPVEPLLSRICSGGALLERSPCSRSRSSAASSPRLRRHDSTWVATSNAAPSTGSRPSPWTCSSLPRSGRCHSPRWGEHPSVGHPHHDCGGGYGHEQLTYEPLLGGGLLTACSVPLIMTYGALAFGSASTGVAAVPTMLGTRRRRTAKGLAGHGA